MSCSWCRQSGHVISECVPEARVIHAVRAARGKVAHAVSVLTDTPALVHSDFAEDIMELADSVEVAATELKAVVNRNRRGVV